MSSVTNIQRWRKIEEVRSKPLDADCGPCASWTGIEIDARTRLPIEVTQSRNRSVVEKFVVSIAGDAVCQKPFGLKPKFVEVGSNPAFAIPSEAGVRAVRSAFQLIECHEVEDSVIFHWLRPVRRWSWCVEGTRRSLGTNRHSCDTRQQSSREDKLKSEASHDTTTVRNIPEAMW